MGLLLNHLMSIYQVGSSKTVYMNNKLIIFLIAILIFISFSYSSNPIVIKTTWDIENISTSMKSIYMKGSYDTTILLIDKKCEKCETWDAYFYIKEFVDLYEHC